MVEPSYCFAASTARYAEFSGGPSVDALTAAACAWPNGVLGSASSTAARAALAPRLVPSSARPGRASAVAPPSSTSRCRKVRLDLSPRSQASTSSARPAWNSRRSRSLLMPASLITGAGATTCDSPDALGRSQVTTFRRSWQAAVPVGRSEEPGGTPGVASGSTASGRQIDDPGHATMPAVARRWPPPGATAHCDVRPATVPSVERNGGI